MSIYWGYNMQNCWKAQSKLAVAEPGQKWRFPHWAWEHTTEFRGEGGPAGLTGENRHCVSNSMGEDPLLNISVKNLIYEQRLAYS
jgi:hypothetical protein